MFWFFLDQSWKDHYEKSNSRILLQSPAQGHLNRYKYYKTHNEIGKN